MFRKSEESRRNFLKQVLVAGSGGLSVVGAANSHKVEAMVDPDVASPGCWGQPAPQWLHDADMYNGQYFDWTEEQFERCKSFPAIVTTDHTKSSMNRLKSYGVNPICYVQECTIPSLKRRAEIVKNQPSNEDNEAYGFVDRTPFYRFVDVDVHAEFVWVDEKNQGHERRRDYSPCRDGVGGWPKCCTCSRRPLPGPTMSK